MKLPPLTLRTPVDSRYTTQNVFGDACLQTWGRRLAKAVRITADTETKTVNIFKYTGILTVLNQWGAITDAPALTNCTNVYADVWDGTNSDLITTPGVDLSGCPVNTVLFKDEINTEIFSKVDADQARIYENRDDDALGRPFSLVAKPGVDNFIRLHLTTNTTLDFTILINFRVAFVNGSTLEFAA